MTGALLKLGGVFFATSSVVAPAHAYIRQPEPTFIHGLAESAAIDATFIVNESVNFQQPSRNVISARTYQAASSSSAVEAPTGGVRLLAILANLRTLQDGYLGPGSIAPTELALQNLALLGDVAGPVHIVPTAGGGVAIEWRNQDVEYTAEIESDGSLFMCVDDPEVDVAESQVDYSVAALRAFLESGQLPADV